MAVLTSNKRDTSLANYVEEWVKTATAYIGPHLEIYVFRIDLLD